MLPPGFSQVVQAFSNVVAKLTNPFTPLLVANSIIDFFTLLVFFSYTHIWIWIPALIFWIFTAIIYTVFAIKTPHMLSSTTIQKYGMQLSVGLGEKGKEISEEKLMDLPTQTATEAKLLEQPKKGEKQK